MPPASSRRRSQSPSSGCGGGPVERGQRAGGIERWHKPAVRAAARLRIDRLRVPIPRLQPAAVLRLADAPLAAASGRPRRLLRNVGGDDRAGRGTRAQCGR